MRRLTRLAACAAALVSCAPAFAQNSPQDAQRTLQPRAPQYGDVVAGTLPPRWLSQGSKCMEIPEWQVHEYNPNLFILRQSPCTDYEKPFVFLFFGHDRALLLDSGSQNGNLAPSLQQTVKLWLKRNQRQSIPLVLIHTHEHGDHVAGDAELQALHDPALPITLIAAELGATKRFYGMANWPEQIGHVDLGGRILDLIPAPGHSALSVALYDRETAILFSGDSLYPGRLYIADFKAFEASIDRLVRFTADKPVAHILGNHVEQMATPFLDYPVGTIFQPNEHGLPLSRGSLLELQSALAAMHSAPHRMSLRDFSLWPALPGPHIFTAEEVTRIKAYVEEQKRTMFDQSNER